MTLDAAGKCTTCGARLALGGAHDYCAACLRWYCLHEGACPVGTKAEREKSKPKGGE